MNQEHDLNGAVELDDATEPTHQSEPHQQSAGEDSFRRPDPLARPPDPAGTQPKIDPRTLESAPAPRHGQLALIAGEDQVTRPLEPHDGVGAPASDLLPVPAPIATRALARPLVQAPHTSRFQFLYGALGALGVAAIVLTGVILSRPGAKPPLAWSSWHPVSEGGDPAAQIAEHVAPRYKLPGGHQLVDVTGGPQAINGQPVVLALRSSGSEPAPLPSNGVFYELCGAGPSCSIPGKASLQRGLLVRREALELALYTFRYIEQASQVVVTFPPQPPSGGSKTSSKAKPTGSFGSSLSSANAGALSRVLLFRPGELSSELSKPLADSLPARVPGVKTIDNSPEAPLVNSLTVNTFYDSTISEQESTLVMLLQAPSLGG